MKSFFKILLAGFIGTLIALLLSGLIFVSILGSIASFSSKKAYNVPSSAILNINFDSVLSERGSDGQFQLQLQSLNSLGASNSSKIGIRKMVQVIDAAAKDPSIKFIYVNAGKINAEGITLVEELRNALIRFRKSGKPVISYAENFSQQGYYLASASDKIYFDSMGMNELLGTSSQVFFLKDILNKLDINIQLIRHGKYKSAGEQFICNDMTPANREQNTVMVKSIWKTIASSICESRDIDYNTLNDKVNNLELTTAKELLDANLIDGILSRNELNEKLCDLFGVDNTDKLAFVSPSDYATAKIKPNIRTKNNIAVIYAAGNIVNGDGKGISENKFANIISKVTKDSTIKAVVLRVNSPGGSAQAAETIRKALTLLEKTKPVIASFGDYAASGGYWISAGTDKIFTSDLTITGSIGVFSMVPSFGDAIRKNLHINPVAVKSNNHSDMLGGMRPLNDVEVKSMQKGVEVVYDKFISIVAEGRDMSAAKVDSIGQGRVWTGADALKVGLANSYGGLNDAINYAVSAANLADDDYDVVEYPKIKTQMEEIMDTFNLASASTKIMTGDINAQQYFKDMYNSLIKSKGVYAELPYVYIIK